MVRNFHVNIYNLQPDMMKDDAIHNMWHFIFFSQICEFEVIIQSMLYIYRESSVQINWAAVWDVGHQLQLVWLVSWGISASVMMANWYSTLK